MKLKEILIEQEKNRYLSILTENKETKFTNLSKVFSSFDKLTGNINEDTTYLTNFITLLEQEVEDGEDDFDPFGHLEKTEKINVEKDCLLSISEPNSKLDHPNFSLPAGYTCPFADACKTMIPRDRKRVHDKLVQDHGDIRCYASFEERYPAVQDSRWRNYDLLKEKDLNGKIELMLNSLKHYEDNNGIITLFRIHESGDFYDLEYFDVWIEVAKARPDILFYAYTKSLPFWLIRRREIPENFKLVASVGGKRDELIDKHKLRSAIIVNSPEEAKKLRLRIDIDDSLAYGTDDSFALLIHGSQQKGTDRAKAAYKNRDIIKKAKKGIFNEIIDDALNEIQFTELNKKPRN